MPQITLKPLDDGQNEVEIPIGKTTIGRGSLPGCNDKKVSRNHAVLEVTVKGEVFLTPTHVNPCFYQPTAENPGQILKKDVPYKLENGDSFSLLPRAYRYQLIVASEPSQTTEQNDISKQDGKTNGSGEDIHDGATTNDEYSDTIVPEKALVKEDAVEKDCSKEDNTFSKKIAEIKDNGENNLIKDSEEKTPEEKNGGALLKESLLIDEPSLITKEDEKEENCAKREVQTTGTESDMNDSSDEGYVDADEKTPVEKVSEENDSMLNLDPISKTEEELEKPETATAPDEKLSEDKLPLEEEENHAAESSNEVLMPILDKTDIPSAPVKNTKKKTVNSKRPQREKQAPKRKAVALESSPKRKGRKRSNFDNSVEGTSRQPGRTSSRTNRQTRQGLSLEDFIVSDDDEWQSDQSEPKPRRKRGQRGGDSGSDWEIDHKKPKKSIHKGWSGSESGGEPISLRKKKAPKGRRKKGEIESNEIASEEEEEPQPSSSSDTKSLKKIKRISCTFGKKCFRRNANHKDQFCHPGDSDYTSENETLQKNDATSENAEENLKKECPYGINCFRKNPQHKKDFKHTKNVRPQREAAKQADKKSTKNSDEIDSYDLNDSFLNEDSDEYKPVDSGSDYESGEKMKKLAKVKANKSRKGKKL